MRRIAGTANDIEGLEIAGLNQRCVDHRQSSVIGLLATGAGFQSSPRSRSRERRSEDKKRGMWS